MRWWAALLLILLAVSPLYGKEEKAAQRPCPLSLEPKWAQYFDVDPPELDERIESALERLKACYGMLSEPDQEALSPLFQRIEGNLRALGRLRAERSAELRLAELQPQSHYSLEEFFNLGRSIRTTRQELASLRSELSHAKSLLDIEGTEADRLTKEYRQIEHPTRQKLVLGLEIMAVRIAILVKHEKMKESRFGIEQLTAKLDQLEQLVLQARRGLDLRKLNVEELESYGDEVRSQRRLARQTLIQAEASAAESVGEGASARANDDLRQVAVIRAGLEVTQLTATLTGLDLIRLLYSWVHARNDLANGEVQSQLALWEEEVVRLTSQVDHWKRILNERQQAAITALSQIPADADGEAAGALELYRSEVQEAVLTASQVQAQLDDMRFVIVQLRSEVVKSGSVTQRAWQHMTGWWLQSWPEVRRVLTFTLFRIGETPFTLLSLIQIVAVFVVAFLLSWALRAWLRHYGKRRGLQQMSTLYALGRLAHYIIFIVAFLVALAQIGLNIDEIAIVLGGFSVGIGIGLRDFVTNFVSGIMILFERNLRLGDFIELESGHAGNVSAIHMQNSVIRTFDGVDVIVPNSAIVGNRLINWTMQDPYQRLRIPFSVAYGSNKDLVSRVVLEAAEALPITLEVSKRPGPNQVWLVEFGESALNFELLVWIDLRRVRFGRSKAAYVWEIESTLRENGITIPFPQRDVHMDIKESSPKPPE